MISVYLCLPIFAYVEDEKKKHVFSYLVIVGFIFNILLPDINYLLGLDITIPFEISVVSGYLMYVLIGYLLTHYQFQSRSIYIGIYCVAIVALLIQVVGTSIMSLHDGQENTLFRESTLVNCCYAVGIFTFGKNYGNTLMKNKTIMRFVQVLSNYTLSIYLIHQFANNLIQKTFLLAGIDLEGTIIYQLLGPVIAIMISIMCAWLIRKIPVVRRIVP